MKTLRKTVKSTWIISLICSMAMVMVSEAKILKFAHVYEANHPLHKGALMAAKILKKSTKGNLDMKVFPASSLGKEAALNEGINLGTIDIIYTGAGFAGSFYGPLSISDFPYTLRNLKHWEAYMKSDLFQELAAGYSRATGGSKIVAVSYYGSRHVTANKPILHPRDMVGLKIRVPNAPAFVLFPKAVGANPTPMAFSEVYLALQQKVVDAQENPLPTIQAKKFYEVQSDISLTGHIVNSIFTIVSGSLLKELKKSDRKALEKALNQSATWITKEVIKSENQLADWFRKKGIKVHEVDRKPFISAVAPALTKGSLPFNQSTYNRLQAIKDAK